MDIFQLTHAFDDKSGIGMPNKTYYRSSSRLKVFDYSHPGAYIVTIVTHARINFFGDISNGEMFLNKIGETVQATWLGIPQHFDNVDV